MGLGQYFYAFIQYLKCDLGFLGAGHICSYKGKKEGKRSVHLNLRPLTALIFHRQQDHEALGIQAIQAHLIMLGADWLVKS